MAKFVEKFKKASRSKKLLITISIAIPVVLLLSFVSVQFTSRPSFCSTCHYMEPYYQSWATSSHNNVDCVKCHFPPGIAGTIRGKLEGLVQVVNYMASSYIRRKPWAEIDNASCLQSGCHDTRMLKGKVKFKNNVVFDHDSHLGEMRRGKSLRCTSCHSQIVQGDHMVVTETACFLCHFTQSDILEENEFEKLSDCTTCHDWNSIPKDEMANFRYDHTDVVSHEIDCKQCHQNTIIGDGFVPKENCYSCHFNNTRLDKYDDVHLLHSEHIEKNKIECIQCHLRIQHKVQKLTADAELECTTCHTEEHNEQLKLFTGKVYPGVEGIPNAMFEAGLNCASCHLFHEHMIGSGGASVKTANQKSCESCHGEGYSHLLKLWEESADKKLAELKGVISQVEKAVGSAKINNKKEVRSYIDKAKHGMNTLEVGKAIHNMKYAELLIKKSYEYLTNALRVGKINLRIPAYKASKAIPNECMNCHTGIDEITRTFEGMTLSHKTHYVDQNVNCNNCHSNAKRHGEVIVNKQGCNSCHHKNAYDVNCKNCHESAFEIYTGVYLGHDSPDIMFEADVECTGCHLDGKRIVRPKVNSCASCHDDSYVATAKEWQADVFKGLEEVRTIIDKMKLASDFIYTFKFRKIENQVVNVEKYSAGGLHNYEFTMELIEEMKSDLKKSQEVSSVDSN